MERNEIKTNSTFNFTFKVHYTLYLNIKILERHGIFPAAEYSRVEKKHFRADVDLHRATAYINQPHCLNFNQTALLLLRQQNTPPPAMGING